MQRGIAKPNIWFSQWLFLYLNIYDMYIIYKINIIDKFHFIFLYIYTFFDEYFKTEEKIVFTYVFLYIGARMVSSYIELSILQVLMAGQPINTIKN